MFSCDDAAKAACVNRPPSLCLRNFASRYALAHLGPSDIDFFGLYDCFPICFIRAVEAVGLAAPGGGGRWVQEQYHKRHLSPLFESQTPNGVILILTFSAVRRHLLRGKRDHAGTFR